MNERQRAARRSLGASRALTFAAALASIVTATEARAQEPQTITLPEALRLALDRNTDVLRARTDVRLRGARHTRETMNFLPSLELSSGVIRSFGRSFSEQEGQILSETSDFFGLDVSASLDLFNGFGRIASIRRTGLEEEAGERRLARARQDAVFQVLEGFTVLLRNRALATVREQERAAQEELLEQVARMVEVGRRPVSDLYQQRAARAEAEAALVEARRQVELSRIELMRVLQLDPLGTYAFDAGVLDSLRRELEDAPVSDGDAYTLSELLETAFAQRPDLESLRASVAAGRQGVRAAQAGYWPTLSLGFDYGSNWSSESPLPFGDQLNARRGGSFRLSLSLPVFDRLQTRTEVQAADAELRTARYNLQDQRQLVALQVRQALLDYRSARAQRRATRERLEAARLAREAARRRYDLGAATFVEVTQAESDYVSAQSAYVNTLYTLILARTVIDHFTGALDATPLVYGTGTP